MNRKILIPMLTVAGGGLLWLGATRAFADADDKPATEEKVVTEVSVQTGKITTATLHGCCSRLYGMIETAPATVDQPAAGAMLRRAVRRHRGEGKCRRGAIGDEWRSAGGFKLAGGGGRGGNWQKKLYEQQNTSLKNLRRKRRPATGFCRSSLHRCPARSCASTPSPVEAVDPTTVVAEVMDLNRLAVSAEIPAAEANDLKSGEPLEVLTKPAVATELLFVSPNVNKDNDTVLIRVRCCRRTAVCGPGSLFRCAS